MKMDGINSAMPVYRHLSTQVAAPVEKDIKPDDGFVASENKSEPLLSAKRTAKVLLDKKGPLNDNVLWEFKMESGMKHAPVLAPDGTLYAAGENNLLYAIDSRTGEKKWDIDMGKEIDFSPLLTKNGDLIITLEDGQVMALDTKDGARKWDFSTGTAYECHPVLAANGDLYVKGKNSLFALDSKTGRQKWESKMNNVEQITHPAVGPDGTLYVASETGRYFSINSTTGKKIKTFKKGAENRLFPPVASPSGYLYLGGPGTMYLLNSKTGKTIWKYSNQYSNAPLSPLVSKDGNVIVESLDKIYGIDRPTYSNDAMTKWRFTAGDHNYFSSSFGPKGMLYAACGNGNLYILDPSSGKEKHVLKSGDTYLTTPPVVAKDGSIFVGGLEGLYALHSSRKKVVESKVQSALEETGTPEASGADLPQLEIDDGKLTIDGVSLKIKQDVEQ